MSHHKIVLPAILAIFLLAACKGKSPKQQETRPAPKTAGTRSSTPSRHAIDPSRRSNDLLLDSVALETFIARQKMNDTLAGAFRRFYDSRDFQLAWFTSDGLTEQVFTFRSLYDYSKDSSTNRKWLDGKLDSLMSADSLSHFSADDHDLLHTELLLTWRFINYLADRYPDEKQRASALTSYLPAEKGTPLEMAKALAGNDHNDLTTNPWYTALAQELKKYIALAETGEWVALPGLRPKSGKAPKDSLLIRVRDRLLQLQYLDKNDSSKELNRAMQTAIRSFQDSHGLTPDGQIGPTLIRELNVSPQTRLQQILLNLDRMRWMPPQTKGKLILVNIPAFRLNVLEDGTRVFDMNIVVGKEGHSTILFAGNLNQIIFNPYWNVPSSIVKKEIEPHLAKNKHYLEENDMEITGRRNGLPVVRQRPGEKNELGKMKFLFPNSFDIYFHDTPHKGLFSQTKRAYSHGCIRLANPRQLADYLLKPMPEWTGARIDSVLGAGEEYSVRLKPAVAVLLCYFTAWMGEKNVCQFRGDIYGHDARLSRQLFVRQ